MKSFELLILLHSVELISAMNPGKNAGSFEGQ